MDGLFINNKVNTANSGLRLALPAAAKRDHAFEPAINSAVYDQMYTVLIADVVDAVRKTEIYIPGVPFFHQEPSVVDEELYARVCGYGDMDSDLPILKPQKIILMLQNLRPRAET